MTHIDINQLANTLTPEQFELLLRKYVQKEINRMPNPSLVMFIVSTGYSGKSSDIQKANWQIGLSGKDQTDGEILAQCVDERIRRIEFSKNCTLRLIEAAPATSTDVFDQKDEITF